MARIRDRVKAGAEPPLFERDRELARLDGLARLAQDGAGGLVVIEGPAGIGKTRLLEVMGGHASEAGMRVLRARGGELEREFAFGVVRQLFEPLLLGGGGERAGLFSGAARLAEPLLGAAATGEPTRAPLDTPFALWTVCTGCAPIWLWPSRWCWWSMTRTGRMSHRCDSSRS